LSKSVARMTRGLRHAAIARTRLLAWQTARPVAILWAMNQASGAPSRQVETHLLRAGMVGMGMIFEETYRPFFEAVYARPLYQPSSGVTRVELAAVASRTGNRAEDYRRAAAGRVADFQSFCEPKSIEQLLAAGVDLVCVATPDDRHFAAAAAALRAGKHVLIEKPSVLTLAELDELERLARGQSGLSQAARPRPQEAAYVGSRR
jgi:hypothetical protein